MNLIYNQIYNLLSNTWTNICILVCFAVQVAAQTQVHVKANVNFNNTISNQDFEPQYFGLFNTSGAGLIVQKNLKGKWFLRADLGFNHRGYKLLSNKTNEIAETTLRTGHIDIAPIVGYQFHPKFNAYAGSYASFIVDEKVKTTANSKYQTPIVDLARSSDLGLIFGLSTTIGRFSLFGQYQLGLTPYQELELTDDQGIDLGKLRFYTSTVQLGCSFRVFGKK